VSNVSKIQTGFTSAIAARVCLTVKRGHESMTAHASGFGDASSRLTILQITAGRSTATASPTGTLVRSDAIHPQSTRNLNIPEHLIVTIPMPTVLQNGPASGP
jgi:hypothetical protein